MLDQYGVTGEEVDLLTTANNRITLVHGTSASPATTDNIQLKWSTVQASALPNEALTLIGDLKITDTQPNPDEVIHSFRLTFDIIPEII